MSQPYSISAAAALLGVSGSTVRRYVDTFADILPDYRAGGVRTLTYDDLLYLWAIMDLHKAESKGTSRSDVLAMINDPDFAGLSIPAQLPTTAETAPEDDEDPAQEDDPDDDPAVVPEGPQEDQAGPGTTLANVSVEWADSFAALLQSHEMKGERLAVVEDRTRRHEDEMASIKWLLYGTIAIMFLVLILLVILLVR